MRPGCLTTACLITACQRPVYSRRTGHVARRLATWRPLRQRHQQPFTRHPHRQLRQQPRIATDEPQPLRITLASAHEIELRTAARGTATRGTAARTTAARTTAARATRPNSMERTQQTAQRAITTFVLRNQRQSPAAMHEFTTEHCLQANAPRRLRERIQAIEGIGVGQHQVRQPESHSLFTQCLRRRGRSQQ